MLWGFAISGNGDKYGHRHRRERKLWAARVELERVVCRRCGTTIRRSEPWDLGHSEDGSPSRPEHQKCNRAAGAARTNEIRRLKERGWAPRVLEDAPTDDPERRIYWGPPNVHGEYLRWSRAWYDWRSEP